MSQQTENYNLLNIQRENGIEMSFPVAETISQFLQNLK